MSSFLLSLLGLVPTFQTAKCKKLLNITMERIKLLSSRREVQLRQLRIDLAELLQLGKEQKAQVWAGLIYKELNLCSVYLRISTYCKSVQRKLKDIARQNACPEELEEPLAGLCFAASCCADLPELQELREIFAMKYGKRFVSSAQELGHIFLVKEEALEEEISEHELKQGKEREGVLRQQHEQETQAIVEVDECNQGLAPRRAPPRPAPLRVASMPSSWYMKHQADFSDAPHPLGCSTMASKNHVCDETNYNHESHVHPRLPNYEDLVANLTALKH